MIDLTVKSTKHEMEDIRKAARSKGRRAAILHALWVYAVWYFLIVPMALEGSAKGGVGGYVFSGITFIFASLFVWAMYARSLRAGKKEILTLYFEGIKGRHGVEYDPDAAKYHPAELLQLIHPFFHRLHEKEDHVSGNIKGHRFEFCEGEVKRGKKELKFILGSIFKPLRKPINGSVRIHPNVSSKVNWIREILHRQNPMADIDPRLKGKFEIYADDEKSGKAVVNDEMVNFLLSLDDDYKDVNLAIDNRGASFAIQFWGSFLEDIDMSCPINDASFGKIQEDLRFVENLEKAL